MEGTKNRMLEFFDEARESEKIYGEMTKEELINLLICNDFLKNSLEMFENKIDLWYYVGDGTGAKYISDEAPKMCMTCLDKKDMFLMSDGEVNIRIPDCMEGMFPELKYGDAPVKIELSINYKE